MDKTRYKVLLVEDNNSDQMAFKRAVREQRLPYDYTIADSISQAKETLDMNEFDVVVLDHSLGDGTAFDVLGLIKNTPVIFTTGVCDETVAVRAMKEGAYDYLPKDMDYNYLKDLPDVIENAITEHKIRNELEKHHKSLEERALQLATEKDLLSYTFSSIGDGIVVVDTEKRIILFNKAAEELTQWQFKEVRGRLYDRIFRIIDEKTREGVENPIDKVLASGKRQLGGEFDVLVSKNGSERPIGITASPIHKKDGAVVGIVTVLRDMSKKRQPHAG
jgi:PAS domain S-box-containing protein